MMLTILEKYFLEHGQLVLPGIGNLRMHQTDAIQMNGQFQPPVHQIVFDAIIEPTDTRDWISVGIEAANHAPIKKVFNMGVIQV